MRFLMLNWRDPENPASGGAERVSLGYLSALVARGHEVYWFANAYKGCSKMTDLEGVQIVRGGGLGTSIVAANRWYQSQAAFDLVIDQHHGIPWFAPWWAQTNCVSFIHEVLGPIWSSFYRWPLDKIGQTQERWTHWLYRNIPFWTSCKETELALRAHGIRQIKRIPYGVHTQALPELPEKALESPIQLITVSRLAPNKRIDHAIHTVKCLRSDDVHARLTIVGSGEETTRLESLVRELALSEHVHFTGSVSEKEKDEWLAKSHLLLHTSVREGWGLNVIEANAMGTPSVVYPVPGLTESTQHGQTGRVSKEETPAALANEIEWLMSQPQLYQTYRKEAWTRSKAFHWDHVLPQACDWLESMALRGCQH
jgi:glycosyltransferase involved in cell wall biosynthesis